MADSMPDGTVCWSEINTRNPEQAKEFYTKLFGWTAGEMDMGDWKYTVLENQGKGFGGVFPIDKPEFDGCPPFWCTYFWVNDLDAAIGRVQEFGGKIHKPKTELPVGFFAVVQDPEGAVFCLWTGK